MLGYAAGDPDAPSTLDSAAHLPRSLVTTTRTSGARRPGPGAGTRTRSSTRSTSRASRCATRGSRRSCGVPTPAWVTRRRSATWSISALPRSSCCRFTRTYPRHSWRRAARSITGATTRSASLRRTTAYSAAVRAGRPGGQVAEFKSMVDALHAAGLEVVLDVVFNHTAEGDHPGPDTVSPRHRQSGVLPSGPGRPAALRRHDRLRQLAERWRRDRAAVDHGFAALLGDSTCTSTDSVSTWRQHSRVTHGSFQRVASFFDLVSQDPVVSRVKLIAEPWDVGPDGQL